MYVCERYILYAIYETYFKMFHTYVHIYKIYEYVYMNIWNIFIIIYKIYMKHIFLYVTSPPGNFSPHNSSFKPSWKKRHLQGGFGGCSVPTEGSGWGSILPLLLPPFPCVLPQGPSLFPGKSRAAGKGSFFQRLQPCQVILSPQIQL